MRPRDQVAADIRALGEASGAQTLSVDLRADELDAFRAAGFGLELATVRLHR